MISFFNSADPWRVAEVWTAVLVHLNADFFSKYVLHHIYYTICSWQNPPMWDHCYGGPTIKLYAGLLLREDQCPNPCIVQGSTVKLNVCELSHLTCCNSVAWVPRTFISHVLFMCYFNFNRILHFISYHLPISNKFILGWRSCISFVSFSPFQGIIWIPKLYTSEACSF